MVARPGSVRCAIYTRKSTEHGLELEFNSLDAQREACEAYIRSQMHEGWQALPQRYDDPAYSGGNLDRPALQRLLKDLDSDLIDIIVVYKIDRLTRSLADFAKLVEQFDKKAISFVAVTQQFNTTTSMGRLTLNVLLSFAQFERELSSERVRDKVAASRRKGKWMGGSLPLGYDAIDKKLSVNESEAKFVRHIYQTYLELKTLRGVINSLRAKRIWTKRRPRLNGRKGGGIAFNYGSLAYLLKNRTYIGEAGHGGKWYPGEHEAIIEKSLFDEVQNLLQSNSVVRCNQRSEYQAPLSGILFDDRGNRMNATYSTKRGVRYRFYVSTALLVSSTKHVGSLARASAPDVEAKVTAALRERFPEISSDVSQSDLLEATVERVELSTASIRVKLKKVASDGAPPKNNWIEISHAQPSAGPRTRIEGDNEDLSNSFDVELVQSVAQAHSWFRALLDGRYRSVEKLAASVKLHPKVVRKKLRLSFLAPDITEAIMKGHQPSAFTLGNLYKIAPLAWDAQRRVLDFTAVA